MRNRRTAFGLISLLLAFVTLFAGCTANGNTETVEQKTETQNELSASPVGMESENGVEGDPFIGMWQYTHSNPNGTTEAYVYGFDGDGNGHYIFGTYRAPEYTPRLFTYMLDAARKRIVITEEQTIRRYRFETDGDGGIVLWELDAEEPKETALLKRISESYGQPVTRTLNGVWEGKEGQTTVRYGFSSKSDGFLNSCCTSTYEGRTEMLFKRESQIGRVTVTFFDAETRKETGSVTCEISEDGRSMKMSKGTAVFSFIKISDEDPCDFTGPDPMLITEPDPDPTENEETDMSKIIFVDTEGGLKVFGYKGTAAVLRIPAEHNGKPVVCFGLPYNFQKPANSEIPYVKKVILPEGVRRIDKDGFRALINLESVTLPSSLETVGKSAFMGCKSLKEIDIPARVPSIEQETFADCTSLERVTLTEGLKSIGRLAFRSCSALKEIKLPGSLENLEMSALQGCAALKEFELPESVPYLSPYLLNACTSLETLILPSTFEAFGANSVSGCESLEKIIFKGSREQWEKVNIDSVRADIEKTEIVFEN